MRRAGGAGLERASAVSRLLWLQLCVVRRSWGGGVTLLQRARGPPAGSGVQGHRVNVPTNISSGGPSHVPEARSFPIRALHLMQETSRL